MQIINHMSINTFYFTQVYANNQSYVNQYFFILHKSMQIINHMLTNAFFLHKSMQIINHVSTNNEQNIIKILIFFLYYVEM